MHIRRIKSEEVPLVLDMWIPPGALYVTDEGKANILNHLQQCVVHADVFCLVAEEAGWLVGFLTASAIPHPSWPYRIVEIEEVHVIESARRRGIGKALVNHAVEKLQAYESGSIRAKVEYASPEALAFWRSMDWENSFTLFFSPREDAKND